MEAGVAKKDEDAQVLAILTLQWTQLPTRLKALQLTDLDEAEGLGDAPWASQFKKMEGRGISETLGKHWFNGLFDRQLHTEHGIPPGKMLFGSNLRQ